MQFGATLVSCKILKSMNRTYDMTGNQTLLQNQGTDTLLLLDWERYLTR